MVLNDWSIYDLESLSRSQLIEVECNQLDIDYVDGYDGTYGIDSESINVVVINDDDDDDDDDDDKHARTRSMAMRTMTMMIIIVFLLHYQYLSEFIHNPSWILMKFIYYFSPWNPIEINLTIMN